MAFILEDRIAAGRELAHVLTRYRKQPNVFVLALPPGGVAVGSEMARHLQVPLDVITDPGERAFPGLAGAQAVLVDDGTASEVTLRAALEAVRALKPAHLVLAIPVAPFERLIGLRRSADEIACLATPEPFGDVGDWYRELPPVSGADAQRLLREHRREEASAAADRSRPRRHTTLPA